MLRLLLESVPVAHGDTVGIAVLSMVCLEEDAAWQPLAGCEKNAPKSACASLRALCEL